MEEIFGKLFCFTSPTFYNWKREKRPIIALLLQYFRKEELEEYISTQRISKLDNLTLNTFFADKIQEQISNKIGEEQFHYLLQIQRIERHTQGYLNNAESMSFDNFYISYLRNQKIDENQKIDLILAIKKLEKSELMYIFLKAHQEIIDMDQKEFKRFLIKQRKDLE